MYASSMTLSTFSVGSSSLSPDPPNSQLNIRFDDNNWFWTRSVFSSFLTNKQMYDMQKYKFSQYQQSSSNQVCKFSTHLTNAQEGDSILCIRSQDPSQSQSSWPASSTSPQTTIQSIFHLLHLQWIYQPSHQSFARYILLRGRSFEEACGQW